MPTRCRCCSFRLLVTALTASALVAVGAVCIALTLPFAIDRLGSMARQQAALLTDDAMHRVFDLYAAPMQQLDTIVNLTSQSGPTWQWPTSSPAARAAAMRAHIRAANAIHQRDRARQFIYIAMYRDNTRLSITMNAPGGAHVVFDQCNDPSGAVPPSPTANASALAAFRNASRLLARSWNTSRSDAVGWAFANLRSCAATAVEASAFPGNVTFDPVFDLHAPQEIIGARGGALSTLEFLHLNSLGGLISLADPVSVAAHAQGGVPSLGLVAPLNIANGPTARNENVGYMYIATAYDSVNDALCQIAQVSIPGWRGYFLDGNGNILASSDCDRGASTRFTKPAPESRDDLRAMVIERRNLVATNVRRSICYSPLEINRPSQVQDTTTLYCVRHIVDIADSVARAIGRRLFPERRPVHARFDLRRVDIDGEAFFASFRPLDLRQYANFNPLVLTLVPLAPILGSVLEASRVVVGLSAACVVAAAVAAAGLISLVLRPLPRIAEAMAKDAAMQPDAAAAPAGTATWFGELHGLEQAAALMHGELRELRAYVPASVQYRAALEGSAGAPGGAAGGIDDCFTETGDEQYQRHQRQPAQAAPYVGRPAFVGSRYLRRGVERRRVTVLVARALGVADAMLSFDDPSVVTSAAGDLVRLVSAGARACGGMLHHSDGDTFTVTFNAARPCERHATNACKYAIWLHEALQRVAVPARIGVGTGPCLVGNLGSAAAKAFSVVGLAAEHARALEPMTAMYGAGCFALVSQGTLEAAGRSVALGTVDLLALPTPGQAPGPPNRGKRLQRVAAILNQRVPWSEQPAHDGAGGEATAAFHTPAECGDEAARDGADANGPTRNQAPPGYLPQVSPTSDAQAWLAMGLGQDAASPLQSWNFACRLLAEGASAADVVESSCGAFLLRPTRPSRAPADSPAAAVDSDAHVPSMMRATALRHRILPRKGAAQAPPPDPRSLRRCKATLRRYLASESLPGAAPSPAAAMRE